MSGIGSRRCASLLLAAAIALLAAYAPAKDDRGVAVVSAPQPDASTHTGNAWAAQAPDEEKRSSIHEVDAYAHLSENMTLSQTRNQAFANAKRQALEAASTMIRSVTQVENFEVAFDQITATSDGSVRVLEQKDIGVEDNTRYHVWVKAEVTYVLKPKAAPETQEASGPATPPPLEATGPLTVRVWTDKKEYRHGEYIRVYLQGNRDFYARVVDITSTGDIVQLLPNAYRQEQKFRAGIIYTIPGEGDRFNLEVTEPFGRDRIVVYASDAPLGSVALRGVDQGLQLYEGSESSLALGTRGIAVTPMTDQPGSEPQGAEFYEASWALDTAP